MALMSDDLLGLSKNANCQKMLSKMGDNFPEHEQVMFSGKLVKINKRGKEQDRVLLITDKALYNLKPKDYGKCQRRIDLERIVSVTYSSASDEFVFHIPEEYDYRYKSDNQKRIIEILSDVYSKKQGKKISKIRNG